MTVYTDSIAKRIFGETTAEALASHHCIRCKFPVLQAATSPEDWHEYLITAICPTCWVAMFPEDDPNVESHT